MVKFSAFKLISAPVQSNFTVHLRRIISVYKTAACKLNVMFFKNSCFFTRGTADPKFTLVREFNQTHLPDQHQHMDIYVTFLADLGMQTAVQKGETKTKKDTERERVQCQANTEHEREPYTYDIRHTEEIQNFVYLLRRR